MVHGLRYKPTEIQVTENGMSVKGENDMELAEALSDSERVAFYKGYIAEAAEAVNVDKVSFSLASCTSLAKD